MILKTLLLLFLITITLADDSSDVKGFDYEDCIACQMVWMQVEMDVGNTQMESDIHNSFVANCNEASKVPIFYPACADMLDNIYGLVTDYMKGFSARQMCEDSRLCRQRLTKLK